MSKRPKSKSISDTGKRAKEIKVSFPEKFIREANSIVLKKEAVSLPMKSRMGMKMAWSDEQKDIQEAWSWGQQRDWTGTLWNETLLPYLTGYESKTWAEIERETAGKDKRHKAYEIDAICDEAQARLTKIELDYLDEVFRFRLGNKPRFYGFRLQHVFFALWWDNEHKICPSDIQDRGKIRKRR